MSVPTGADPVGGKADDPLDWVDTDDQRARAMEVAESGSPRLVEGSPACPAPWGDEALTTQLGEPDQYGRAFCVRALPLPEDVLAEVLGMEAAQLVNDSDYDARVTKLYVFENESFSPDGVELRDVDALAEALHADGWLYANTRFRASGAEELGRFRELEGLAIDGEFVAEPALVRYLRDLTADQKILTVEFGDGVELYPGGGIYATFALHITDDHLIYVKKVWWDA